MIECGLSPPASASAGKRDVQLNVRLTAHEKFLLQEAARRLGFKGVSDKWGPTKLGDRGWIWFDKDLITRARLAESWPVNAMARIGPRCASTKWSDGQPFTSGCEVVAKKDS
jgi:hypothetical protein